MKKTFTITEATEQICKIYRISKDQEQAVRKKVSREVGKISPSNGKLHEITNKQLRSITWELHDYLTTKGDGRGLLKNDIEWLIQKNETSDEDIASSIPFNGEPAELPKDTKEFFEQDDEAELHMPKQIDKYRPNYPQEGVAYYEYIDDGDDIPEPVLQEDLEKYESDYTIGALKYGGMITGLYKKEEKPAADAYEEINFQFKMEALFDRFYVMNEDLLREDVRRVVLGQDHYDNDYILSRNRLSDRRNYIKPISKDVYDKLNEEAIINRIEECLEAYVDNLNLEIYVGIKKAIKEIMKDHVII